MQISVALPIVLADNLPSNFRKRVRKVINKASEGGIIEKAVK
jgi:hypothetical protein